MDGITDSTDASLSNGARDGQEAQMFAESMARKIGHDFQATELNWKIYNIFFL